MSREQAMEAFIESGMELRRDDIELGRKLERERIINFLNDMVEQLDKLRPESYKSVADKMDFRIRVIQMVIKKIEESDEATSIDSGA